MFHFLIGLLPLIGCAAGGANLRRQVTDLSVYRRFKHSADERSSHSGLASPPEVTIELTNYKGVQYVGPITVGGQTLMATYDTGSYDLMAVSDHCSSCHVPKKLKVFRNNSSNTFKKGKSSTVFTHDFAGGQVMARLDSDTVQMGSGSKTISAANVPIWQVTDTTLPQWLEEDICKFTAIAGLGFGEVAPDSPHGVGPVVQLLERTGTQHFATCFQRGKSNPGFITLNPAYDFSSASFKSMFRKVPVTGQKHWAVEQGDVSYFNGDFTDRRCTGAGECVAIIDSGTSLIGVPGIHTAFIMELAALIKNDCSNIKELPDLVFKLGDHSFPLPASAYVMQLEGKCYGAFMSLTMETDRGLAWVLGLPFLRHFYTLWDRQGPALYIAEQGDGCKPKPSEDNTVKLSRIGSAPTVPIEPTIGDKREARMPSWAPHGSEKITI